LMVMGGRLTRRGPKIGVPVTREAVEKGEKWCRSTSDPQTLKLSWSTNNENFMV
jgi:hypothetical protein